ncbi:MAG: response regulator transcription factor [Pirellulales bacterium]|nr:response regulator transcription factor [Pirellulales bacterium]
MSIRLLIADDHEVVRSGLASILADAEIEIVGQAANGAEALQLAKETKPDIILLDIRMPEVDGLDALEKIRDELPETRVIILSTYDNPTYIARAVTQGASDYLLKGSSRDELVAAIRATAAGDTSRRSAVLRRVASVLRTTGLPVDEEVTLTMRENQVLRHVALGLSNKEIGKSLSISIETVKEHVQNILRKINVVDRTQAAVWAVRKGLV